MDGSTRRMTRAAWKVLEFSAAQREDKGRLSRHFADLNHRFNRNRVVETEMTDKSSSNQVDSGLSGNLAAGELGGKKVKGMGHGTGAGGKSFRANRGAPESNDRKPSSPSSSETHSDSFSDTDSDTSSHNSLDLDRNKRHKEEEEEKEKAIRHKYKHLVNTPTVYDGTPNLKQFDNWTHQVDLWCLWHELNSEGAVMVLTQFLSGKALVFFMTRVATSLKRWDLKAVYQGLFDYCFPTQKLREKLMKLYQGKWTVRHYAYELETLASRFPDVTPLQIAYIFWEGIKPELRYFLIMEGLSPEQHDMERLLKYASRHEDAMESLRHEEKCLREGTMRGRFGNNL